MPAQYDFALSHTWGGAMIEPLTADARAWAFANLSETACAWGAGGFLGADFDAPDVDYYLIDERDGLDVAAAIAADGLTFPNMERLAAGRFA